MLNSPQTDLWFEGSALLDRCLELTSFLCVCDPFGRVEGKTCSLLT